VTAHRTGGRLGRRAARQEPGRSQRPTATLTGIASIHTIAMEHRIPAGALGPEPVILDVRAYLVPHPGGLVLVDTGMEPTGRAIDSALGLLGAAWTDVSHIAITHNHPDHVGALDHARQHAHRAAVTASPLDGLVDIHPVVDGDTVGPLRVVASPGHTPGHLSLLDESQGTLLVGDCLGTADGRLMRAPEQFTADLDIAEQTLHRLRAYRGTRILFSHGPELTHPWDELDALLEQ
jgi:glyoxylase-like metal-dependent hydrolase (beta-lactamase superfamily II)